MTRTNELPTGLGGITEAIAGAVRAEAARRRMNQADLRRCTGLSKTTAHQRWHGVTAWTVGELVAIAQLLEVSVVDLLLEAGVVRPASELVPA